MTKHLGNMVSWSSVFVVILSFYTQDPVILTLGIFIACFMDLFDGKVARAFGDKTKSALIFGELTDSLCDIFNFGVAPSLLMNILIFDFNIGIIHLISIFIFIWAGIFRLARFSATKDKPIVDYFIGLPITVAGPIVALLAVVLKSEGLIILFTLLIAYLMAANIKVKKLKI